MGFGNTCFAPESKVLAIVGEKIIVGLADAASGAVQCFLRGVELVFYYFQVVLQFSGAFGMLHQFTEI